MGFTKDQITITQVLDIGDDLIEIHGHTPIEPDAEPDTEPVDLTAQAWKSALTNFFPPKAYYPDDYKDENLRGHRDPDAKPREMTAEEKLDFCKEQILNLLPKDEQQIQEPVDLGISG